MRKLILVLLIISFSENSFAQKINWKAVEIDINNKKNLNDLQNKLEQEKLSALEQQKFGLVGRCYNAQLIIRDFKSEDTSFFINSYFIDSILNYTANNSLKSIMHFLQAKRLILFKKSFYDRTNRNLFKSRDGGIEYSRFTKITLDSLILLHFKEAKSLSLISNLNSLEDFLWLSSDPLLFFFKPTFLDVIFAEQINYVTPVVAYYNRDDNTHWLAKTQDEFIQNVDSIKERKQNLLPTIKLYIDWLKIHKAEPDAYYFIETLARKYLYNNSEASTQATFAYQSYLQQLLSSMHNSVRAHSIYQHCLYLNAEAANYNKENVTDEYYYPNISFKPFDTTFRWNYNKAIKLFTENEKLLDSFSFIKQILVTMKEKIIAPELKIKMQNISLPGKSIEVITSYKNVQNLFIKIVKLNAFDTIFNYEYKTLQYLKSLPASYQQTFAMPIVGDYQLHNSTLSLPSLSTGRYYLIYSNQEITNNSKASFIAFAINNVAVINNDDKVFILDRTSGFPIIGSSVLVKYKKDNKFFIAAKKHVNKNGYITVHEENVTGLYVISDGDTSLAFINNRNQYEPDEIYKGEDTEDLIEYYKDNMELHLFTDRSIYRPGQTVFYKGIITMRNPKTGEALVLNKENLNFPRLQKLLNKEVKEFLNEKIEVYIQDPFSRNVDTILVKVNEFGSFAGSYKIPKDAATGEWEFDADIEIDYDSKAFKVEEYKRPSFELIIIKPTIELRLGDDFATKVKVRSFAGALLNNTAIDYTVALNISVPKKDSITGAESIENIYQDLVDTKGYTNNAGELEIKVSNSLIRKYNLQNDKVWTARYTITAEATDAIGETHEDELSFSVTNRPVKIYIETSSVMEREDLAPVRINASSSFTGNINKKVKVKLYKVSRTKTEPISNLSPYDYIYTSSVWKYNLTIEKQESKAEETLIYETTVLTNEGKLILPNDKLYAGFYRIDVSCKEENLLLGEGSRSFTIIDKNADKQADEVEDFHYLKYNYLAERDTVNWLVGNKAHDIFSIFHIAYLRKNIKGLIVTNKYETRQDKKGVKEWKYKIPQNSAGEITLTHIYILNGEIYKNEQKIQIRKDEIEPEIIIEQYRTKLSPGAKETFVVTVKTKNTNVAAELMTTMYDASLDKIEKHEWKPPFFRNRFNVNNEWDSKLSFNVNSSLYMPFQQKFFYDIKGKSEMQLYWLNPLDYAYSELNVKGNYEKTAELFVNATGLMGKVAGLNIVTTNGLEEVVVIGYGSSTISAKKLYSSSLSITLRGISSLSASDVPLVVIDGVVFTGDLSKFNVNLLTEAIVLKGADATAIYGSRAAQGVLIISTKGPIVLPKPEEPVVVARKNFSETAFFFPQVHADKEGFYKFTFTMPESVTEWNWKIMAHTKGAFFTKVERKVFTQLPLMVQPNMPRFLYQGDKIVLQSRVSNLDTADIAGYSFCTIEDVVTGENITSKLVATARQDFSVVKKSNSSVAFTINVPENLLHPIKIKITAKAGALSDGEEHVIPILSKKILVVQNQQIVFANKDTIVNKIALPNDATPYGIGLYIAPKPQAAILNALPYLAFYKYNCAEQAFNKLLAHVVAANIMRTDTALQKMQQSKVENEKSEALPDELSEQTMPWLQLNNIVSFHQSNLSKLMDTVKGNELITTYFNELKGLQNSDGGITWYKDGKSNEYISNYILAGFGKLQLLKLLNLKAAEQNKYNDFIKLLLRYCDTTFITPDINSSLSNKLFYLQARKYYLNDFPLTNRATILADSTLTVAWKNVDTYYLSMQAALIKASLIFGNEKNKFKGFAVKQLASISQLAIADNINGIRWKDISNSDDLSTNDEETIVSIAEAFETNGESVETINGIIKWLLKAKQQHNWSSTKSTADVVGLLSRHQQSIASSPIKFSVNIANTTLSVTDNLLKGNLINFSQQSFPEKISLTKDESGVVYGGLNYYYFTAYPPINEIAAGVKISKKVYRFINNKMEVVNENTVLKIADKLQTIITIETAKQLKYVFIDEKRAAALEPSNALSGYEYNKGFGYYQSVRDAGYQFFAEQIPSGISTITYETIVAKEGTFDNGPISLQCMYQPAVKAYGAGSLLKVMK